jgi:hypothetical protein
VIYDHHLLSADLRDDHLETGFLLQILSVLALIVLEMVLALEEALVVHPSNQVVVPQTQVLAPVVDHEAAIHKASKAASLLEEVLQIRSALALALVA